METLGTPTAIFCKEHHSLRSLVIIENQRRPAEVSDQCKVNIFFVEFIFLNCCISIDFNNERAIRTNFL